jgi:hypothetical protein
MLLRRQDEPLLHPPTKLVFNYAWTSFSKNEGVTHGFSVSESAGFFWDQAPMVNCVPLLGNVYQMRNLLIDLGLSDQASIFFSVSLCAAAGRKYSLFSLVKRHLGEFLHGVPGISLYGEALSLKQSYEKNLLLNTMDLDSDIASTIERLLFLLIAGNIDKLRHSPLKLSENIKYYWLEL